MARNGMVSDQQLADARFQVDSAKAALHRGQSEFRAAQATVAEAKAQTLNQEVLSRGLDGLEARLQEIRARQERLEMDIRDHQVTSPVTGIVARRFVDTGEYVQPGQNLIMVYQQEDLWVEANIKETALRKVQPGQAVDIQVDAYPDEVFEGVVAVVGAAATSEFALLPSPNPSGNFTKTTQRVPVRIVLKSQDVRLRPGLMVEAGIRVDN